MKPKKYRIRKLSDKKYVEISAVSVDEAVREYARNYCPLNETTVVHAENRVIDARFSVTPTIQVDVRMKI